MNEYMAINSDEYLCKSSFCELIAAWLNAFQGSQDVVRLNRSAREQSVKRFDDLETALYKNLPFLRGP